MSLTAEREDLRDAVPGVLASAGDPWPGFADTAGGALAPPGHLTIVPAPASLVS